MKFVVAFVVLCLMSLVMCKKEAGNNEENVDAVWTAPEYSEQHQAKKSKDSKVSHHHHSKHKKMPDSSEHKHYGRAEGKKSKYIPKQAIHEVSPQDAELQANLHTSRKHLKDQHFKDALQDLHLQDLAYEENLKVEKHSKSPHQYQRGQHKTDHFSENKDAQNHHHLDAERKLFVDQNSKEQHGKHSHPILEDSFETLQEKKPKQDGKKHNKKYNKHKKPVDKYKKEKTKSSKKEKKNKKDKKQKKW